MSFFYFSIVGTILALVVSGVALGVFWLYWTKVFKRKWTSQVFGISAAVMLLLPWTEEFWIAYNFGRLCRTDAGLKIVRTAEVDGFFNDSENGDYSDIVNYGYRFIEGRGQKGTTRLSLGNPEWLMEGIQRYKNENPGADIFAQYQIRVDMGNRTQALIFPKQNQSWVYQQIDKPTARYWFHLYYHVPVKHQIERTESKVVDSQSGETIARYVVYVRKKPWFYVGLDSAPYYACDGPDGGPNTKGNLGIYNQVLIPARRAN